MPIKNLLRQSDTVPIKMNEHKAAVRSRCLSLRKTLPPKSADIKDFENIPQFESAKTVFCYVSAENEVSTHSLIKQMLALNKEVLVPLCTDKCGNMVSVKINSLDDLSEGMYGIYEPISHTPFDKTKIDVAIVPGVAFDKDGYRIGYGKGYYDRFLADISPLKIGLTHSELFFDSLPHDENDVQVNIVIKK